METTLKKVKRFPRRTVRTLLIQIKTFNQIFEHAPKQTVVTSREILTPEVEGMNFFWRAKGLEKSYYQLPEGYLRKLRNVVYNTGDDTLMTTRREILAESSNADRLRHVFSVRNTYFSRLCCLPDLDDGSHYSIFHSRQNNFYHTLIDNLPRLYLLGQFGHPVKLLFSGQPTAVESYFIDKLKPSNVDLEFVEPRKSYLIERLIFPSFLTQHFSGYLPSEYLDYFRARVLPQRPRNKVNRIFIVRGVDRVDPHRQRRRFLNAELAFNELKKIGFKRYVLEDLSIQEQIELFYDAEIVVGAHGAGLSNIIFSENIRVLELFANDCILPYYYYLSKSLGHGYSFLYGSKNNMHADFSIDIARMMQALEGSVPSARSKADSIERSSENSRILAR